MAAVNPYLSFNGNCEAAFNFYKSVFGGEFTYLSRFKDMPSEQPIPDTEKEKILHMLLPIGSGTILMGSDTSEVFGIRTKFGDNISLSVNTDSENETQRIFNELSAGGQIIMPLEKMFWGALFGHFTDKYGVLWMINYEYNGEVNE